MVEMLIAAGSKVNQPAKFGYTPLMFASLRGRIDAVDLLIKNGADINQMNEVSLTAFSLII